MKVGLNLFSVRNLIETEEEYEKTTMKLKKMGYSYVQYSGGVFDAERIRRVSEKTGMPVVLTHVPYDRIVNDIDNLMREHESFGCRNIGLGGFFQPWGENGSEWKKAIDELENVSAKMQKNGFTFFYHNHHHEFVRHDGQTIFDYIIEHAPHVHFTFDTYWAQLGGVNISEYVEKLSGRIECVHLKDYQMREETDGVQPHFAPLGQGNLNFPAIVQAMRKAGTEYFLVEQDDAADLSDTLSQVEISVRYAQNL